MFDTHGRGYMAVEPEHARALGLPAGKDWWWCVLPMKKYRSDHYGGVPYPGWVVGTYAVQQVATGFIRGRTVGVVELK